MSNTPERSGKASRFKINLNPDQLKKSLRRIEMGGQNLFSQVTKHSRDYQDVLRLDETDIESMVAAQGPMGMFPTPEQYKQAALVQLEIDRQQIGLFATHTCCHDYGDFDADEGWKNLLMAIADNPSLNKGAGDGTAWITAVPENWHQKILDAIRANTANDDLADELFRGLKR